MTPAFLFTLHNFHLGAEPRTLEMTPILRSHDFRPKSSSAPKRRAEPADWITQEADSQEVSSCGSGPGHDRSRMLHLFLCLSGTYILF